MTKTNVTDLEDLNLVPAGDGVFLDEDGNLVDAEGNPSLGAEGNSMSLEEYEEARLGIVRRSQNNGLAESIKADSIEAVTELLKLGSDEVQDALGRLAPHFHFGVVDYLDDLEMFYIQNTKHKTYGHNDLKYFLLSEKVLGGVTDSAKQAAIIQDMQGTTI